MSKKGVKVLNSHLDECEFVRAAIATQELAIQQEEAHIKDILRECGGDPKKRERRMPEIKRHMDVKARLESAKQHHLQQLQQLRAAEIEAFVEACEARTVDVVAAVAEAKTSAQTKGAFAHVQDVCEFVRAGIANHELAIQQEDAQITDILKECGGDPKKREMRMPEIKKHMEAKARSVTINVKLNKLLIQLAKVAAEAETAADARAADEAAAAAAVVRFWTLRHLQCLLFNVLIAFRLRASATIPMHYSRNGTADLSRWVAAFWLMAAPKTKPSAELSVYAARACPSLAA